MKKETQSTEKTSKKAYQKPLLIRYEQLTSVIANGSPLLGCTRF